MGPRVADELGLVPVDVRLRMQGGAESKREMATSAAFAWSVVKTRNLKLVACILCCRFARPVASCMPAGWSRCLVGSSSLKECCTAGRLFLPPWLMPPVGGCCELPELGWDLGIVPAAEAVPASVDRWGERLSRPTSNVNQRRSSSSTPSDSGKMMVPRTGG